MPRLRIGGANPKPGGMASSRSATLGHPHRQTHFQVPPNGGPIPQHTQTLGRHSSMAGHANPQPNSQSMYNMNCHAVNPKQSSIPHGMQHSQLSPCEQQLHPQNLVRDGNSPMGSGSRSPDPTAYHPRTILKSPKGPSPAPHLQRQYSPLPPHISEEPPCRREPMPDIAKDASGSDFVVFNCDLVHADRTTDVWNYATVDRISQLMMECIVLIYSALLIIDGNFLLSAHNKCPIYCICDQVTRRFSWFHCLSHLILLLFAVIGKMEWNYARIWQYM